MSTRRNQSIDDAPVSVAQACARLGISDSGVRRLMDRGILRCFRPSPRRVVIVRASLDDYIAQRLHEEEGKPQRLLSRGTVGLSCNFAAAESAYLADARKPRRNRVRAVRSAKVTT